MHSLPLFSLLCSSENCQSLRNASQDTGGYHRLRGRATGCVGWSSAQNESIGWELTAGRQKMLPVGKQCLQNLQLTAAEGKTCMAMQFKACMHQTHSLSCYWLKGGMCLDSRTTNHAFPCMMAQRIKSATLISNACNAIKQTRVPNLYHTLLQEA